MQVLSGFEPEISASKADVIAPSLQDLPAVGFEPTRPQPTDLKSVPLDQLGHAGKQMIF